MSCKLTASYLSDALGDLVNAVNYSFTEEPGEYRWILIPQEKKWLAN